MVNYVENVTNFFEGIDYFYQNLSGKYEGFVLTF